VRRGVFRLGGDLNFERKKMLHLAAANGDIRILKVLLYPQRTPVPEKNF
jgi:hypothetical protein